MAKYCANCGKQLPDGVEVCPDCNVGATEAALFTRLKIEPEVLMGVETLKPDKKEKRAKLKEKLSKAKNKIILYSCAVILLAGVVTAILLTRPEAVVVRALNGGQYEKAYQTFQLKLADKGPRDPAIDKAIVAAGERICQSFANHEISTQEAANALNLLYGFGEGTQELLEPIRSQYDQLNGSMAFMEEADRLFDEGDFLAAHEIYMRVLESDSEYEDARTRAQECFDRYAAVAIEDARALAGERDYEAALRRLAEADAGLLEYDTFSAELDSETEKLRSEYEIYALGQAEAMAGRREYQEAIDVLTQCAAFLEFESENVTSALDGYRVLLRDKQIGDANDEANRLFDEGDFAGAFAVFEDLTEEIGDEDGTIAALTTDLQFRFEKEMLSRAETAFGGQRDNLEEAIAILDGALEVRELDSLAEYREELAQYLPANLAEVEYLSKEGIIFRNSGDFEALDGVSYSQGWIWGENKSSVTFQVDGKYDQLVGTFATRRDDNRSAGAHYEVWCDGEMTYKSPTLYHYLKDSQEVNVDISGCKEMKIVFVCDYQVNTSENGYCYHGLCDIFMLKNMPEV